MIEKANFFIEMPDLPDCWDGGAYNNEVKGSITIRRIVLGDGEWRQFMDLVDSPPKPSQRLVEVMTESDDAEGFSGPLGNGGC